MLQTFILFFFGGGFHGFEELRRAVVYIGLWGSRIGIGGLEGFRGSGLSRVLQSFLLSFRISGFRALGLSVLSGRRASLHDVQDLLSNPYSPESIP